MKSKQPTRAPLHALDLFCCAGGASDGLARAGFNVQGVDVERQPEYPYQFIGIDALTLPVDHLRKYHFIWASPPCQLSERWGLTRSGTVAKLLEANNERM